MRDQNKAISSRVHIFTCKMSEIVLAHFPLCVRQSRQAHHEEDSNLRLAQKQCPVSHNAMFKYWLFPRRFFRLPFVLADVPASEHSPLFNVTQKAAIFRAPCTFCLEAKGGTYFIP